MKLALYTLAAFCLLYMVCFGILVVQAETDKFTPAQRAQIAFERSQQAQAWVLR